MQQDDNDPPHGVIAITNFSQLRYHKEKKTLVEGEVLEAANGSSNVSEYINLTCFSIIRIKIFGR